MQHFSEMPFRMHLKFTGEKLIPHSEIAFRSWSENVDLEIKVLTFGDFKKFKLIQLLLHLGQM